MQRITLLVMIALALLTIGNRRGFAVALLGALVVFGGYKSIVLSASQARTCSYFGVYTVRGDATLRQLAHGTTVHGTELLGTPERERTPTAYYVRESGVGRAMAAVPALYGPAARIGVVGLGAGTLACYAVRGQDWRFYEIDPAVERIARTRFRFLGDCLPAAQIVLGDARLRLAATPPVSLNLLALDAFSSDAIPMHLVTREAFATYARVLSPRGVLLVHISNRYLDLAPVVAAAAKGGGWQAARLTYRPGSLATPRTTGSDWIALSRAPDVLTTLRAGDRGWKPLPYDPRFTPWTDDYSTILPLLKARP